MGAFDPRGNASFPKGKETSSICEAFRNWEWWKVQKRSGRSARRIVELVDAKSAAQPSSAAMVDFHHW